MVGTPEVADPNGITCGIALGYGWACQDLTNPPYSYDCHCSCAGSHLHPAVIWTTVQLRGEYSRPVVVTSIPSASDPEHITVRLRNVQRSSFDIGIQESRCLDKAHGEEKVGWVVVDSGVHNVSGHVNASMANLTAAGGLITSTVIQAGSFSISQLVDYNWFEQRYDYPFHEDAAVFTQVWHTGMPICQFVPHRVALSNNETTSREEELLHLFGKSSSSFLFNSKACLFPGLVLQ